MTKSWDKNTIKDLQVVFPKQDHEYVSWLLSSETSLPRLTSSSWSFICLVCSISQQWVSVKRLNHFTDFNSKNTDDTSHFSKYTTSNAALSSYQTFLPCALHSEVWFCVLIGNSNTSIFHQKQAVEIWDSHYLPNFPPLSLLNCRKTFTSLSLLQNIHPVQL